MSLLWSIVIALAAIIVAALAGFAAWYKWMTRTRRPHDPGYKYVMVADDGSAREVTAVEQDFLETDFHPADGGRPYIKFRYEAVDGWGSLAGFLLRRQLPNEIQILQSTPEKEQSQRINLDSILEAHRQAGDSVVERADGTFSVSPNEALSTDDRMARFKQAMNDQQADKAGGDQLDNAPK